MSGIGRMNKGTLEIDLQQLVEHLSDDARTNLARYLVADDRLFEAVLQCVIDGDYHQDDEEGSWWFSPSRVAELRAKLQPMMTDVAVKLVQHLLYAREQESLLRKRAEDWAWRMFHVTEDEARAAIESGVEVTRCDP